MADQNEDRTKSGLPPEMLSILGAIHDAVFLLDNGGRIVYCSPSVTELYDWVPGKMLGRHVTEVLLFEPDFREEVLDVLEHIGSWDVKSERLRPDGTQLTVQARWSTLPGAIGEAHIIGVEQDITESVVREQELRQARKLAKIGILSEGIAHELRNPLSYALSAAQLLSDERISEDVRTKCVQTITTGLRKAGLIVENLLSLGKPNTQFARAHVRLTDVMTEAIDAASTHASYRLVRIDKHFQDPELTVWGNHDMLVQVFHNVISNALNEMPEGGHITISGESGDSAVLVRITDSGPGVSDEQLRHLFDPFFTASSSGHGTGLGLTLSYYIMKEHRGSIEVESHPGAGATFVLVFPHRAQQTEPLPE